jgi:hypothetical protein
VLFPPAGRQPEAAVHFLGGAFVGAAPQLAYRPLLEALASRGVLVIATPFSTSFDHLRVADEVQYKFDRALGALGPDAARLPVYGVGHSLGSVLHALVCARYAPARAGNALMAFNNRPATDTVGPGGGGRQGGRRSRVEGLWGRALHTGVGTGAGGARAAAFSYRFGSARWHGRVWQPAATQPPQMRARAPPPLLSPRLAAARRPPPPAPLADPSVVALYRAQRARAGPAACTAYVPRPAARDARQRRRRAAGAEPRAGAAGDAAHRPADTHPP